jgi:hypothetical protein
MMWKAKLQVYDVKSRGSLIKEVNLSYFGD